MAQLICQDCGEVLEEGLSESEAERMRDGQDVLDERDHDHDSDGDDSGSSNGLDNRTDVDDMEDELEEDFEEKMDEVSDDEGVEDTTEDVEDYVDAVEEGGVVDDEDFDVEVLVGTGNEVTGARWQQLEQDAEPVSQILEDKLRQKRRDQTHRNQRSGTFDSSQLVSASRGDPRVFKRQEEGDEAEYEAYFILDRSYSMKRTEMRPAEDAAAMLLMALEDVGVKTELMDFYDGNARVIETKTQDVDDENGNILQGNRYAKGDTPLGKTLQVLSDRIEGTDGQPFVVVVTDGQPSEEDVYIDAAEDLEDRDVPILGVTIGEGATIDDATADRLYHHHVTVEDNSKLKTKLEELARGVMF